MANRAYSTKVPGSPLRRGYLGPIPPPLRAFKGTGRGDAAHLATDEFLVWSELVGERLVVVFHHGHDGCRTFVGILTPVHDRFERLEWIHPYHVDAQREGLRSLLGNVPDRDDGYALANRLGIHMAARWVRELREQHAPTGPAPAEAWLRRQLAGLRPEGGA
jgi:hypothetical protein